MNSVGSNHEFYQESGDTQLSEVEQADQEIGNRLKDEIKRLLLSEQFQQSASVDQMTELLMQRLADIAEEEDQRQY